jgi:hypothetical protein
MLFEEVHGKQLRKAEVIGRSNMDMVVGGNMLPCDTTMLLAGAFSYVGLGSCNCLGGLELKKLCALNGFWAREVLQCCYLPIGGQFFFCSDLNESYKFVLLRTL